MFRAVVIWREKSQLTCVIHGTNQTGSRNYLHICLFYDGGWVFVCLFFSKLWTQTSCFLIFSNFYAELSWLFLGSSLILNLIIKLSSPKNSFKIVTYSALRKQVTEWVGDPCSGLKQEGRFYSTRPSKGIKDLCEPAQVCMDGCNWLIKARVCVSSLGWGC